MTAAIEPVGVSQVFPEPPCETKFKDRYFVSGSGIAKWFKDPAQDWQTNKIRFRTTHLLFKKKMKTLYTSICESLNVEWLTDWRSYAGSYYRDSSVSIIIVNDRYYWNIFWYY